MGRLLLRSVMKGAPDGAADGDWGHRCWVTYHQAASDDSTCFTLELFSVPGLDPEVLYFIWQAANLLPRKET